MITQNEISSLNLSPTKKDFVQIWNELIEVASKITERWDPTSTNESDPGIVLLKVLAGIADKLNYNIDKNILEAFMPTAAQMESMRKLCELVGYDIKYYQSAETTVRISYNGNTTDTSEDNEERLPEPGGLQIPKFTTITNADKDITFVTTNTVPALITNTTPWVEVPCIEGQVSQCESINENNLITLSQLDDNNRYYLPEIQIAENGIFVYNAATITGDGEASLADGAPWAQVSNLNTHPSDTRIFKFGYDSLEGRPYLAFPDDVSSLIGDGLFIYFIRTSGQSGNISPRTLEVLEIPAGEGWSDYSAEQFEVVNKDATTNGANIETISAAYNNFKKTVGTFDTLVTCRDYMNKIYSLMDMSNSPYVSNILVTDIRNDINNAITLCSCNEFGILYKETPLYSEDKSLHVYRRAVPIEGQENEYKLYIDQNPNVEIPLMDHFDLRLYPFKTFTQVSSGTEKLVKPYNRSFTYTEQMNEEIKASLKELKTCAHNLTAPAEGDIVAINNYLRLNALIATSNKVSTVEAEAILHNVKVALVNEFNLRNLDFGEEIPFDSILSVIENADSRIKVVSLQEPTVLTTYSVKERDEDGSVTSKEYGIASTDENGKPIEISGVKYGDDKKTAKGETAKDIYNKLVLRNILAGRASLFNYDETFVANNSEKPYTITREIDITADSDFMQSLEKIIEAGSTEGASDAEKEAAELAKKAKTTINSTDSSGEYVLPVVGLAGGTVILKVYEKSAESSEPAARTAYETYEPAFILDSNNTPTVPGNTIDNITRVEAICELSNEKGLFNNLKLAKNEVIKFRAPNLITTKTFPAYVYYRYENDTSNSSESGEGITSDGSPATCETLADFINRVTKDTDNGISTFFKQLWTDAGVGNFGVKTFTASYANKDKPAFSTVDPTEILRTALAIGADEKLNNSIYITAGDLENAIKDYFNTEANQTSVVTFTYYPLEAVSMNIWSNCIRSFDSSLPEGTTLWRLSSTASYPIGKLVTANHRRLFAQSSEYLLAGNAGTDTYICTDLGADPIFSSIASGSDVELKGNAKLYIHYTPSSTNEDGETVNAEPVSVVYCGSITDPVVIKPTGFTLMPSEDVNRQGTSWKKTDVDFNGEKKNLLALAPNEQIELRSLSRVVLDKPARFYRNFDAKVLDGNVNEVVSYELKDGEYIFYTNQNTQEAAYYGSGSVITLDKGAFIPKASDSVEISQILEQGLHIVPWSDAVLLTSNRKVTITEYQYVTLVEGDTLDTLSIDSNDSDSTEKGDSKDGGYTISNARWKKCSADVPITYTTSGAESSTKLPKVALNSKSSPSTSWEVCSFLELSTSPGYSQQLRAVDVASEEPTSVANKLKVYVKADVDSGERLAAEIAPRKTSIPGSEETYEPVSVKLNTIAQVASGTLKVVDDSEETDIDTEKVNVQLKIFKEQAPAKIELTRNDEIITPISNKTSVPINADTVTVNNYWSKIDIPSELRRANLGDPSTPLPNAVSLNFMVPNSDMFGIFSIYLDAPESNSANNSRVFIDIPTEFGSYKQVVSIFNYEETIETTIDGEQIKLTDYWWSEGIDDADSKNRLYLRAGLNCIKIMKSCTLLIKAEENADGSLLYDNMRLVKGVTTNGVNLNLLKFKNTSEASTVVAETADETLAKAVLDGIRALDKDHEFYYNVPIENSLAIEFDDNNVSSFDSPYTLYDINNINNSFVVSKLDIKYLDDGLKIAKSSKY